MKIYLDACALNRLTDDQRQPRIRDEAKAVELIVGLIASGRAELIASMVLRLELARNPNSGKRFDSLKLLSYAGPLLQPNRVTFRRAERFESFGYGGTDALHLALAEQADADILLTTDDRFCKLVTRRVGQPTVDAAIRWIGRGRQAWCDSN